MMETGYEEEDDDVNDLVQQARSRWLNPVEVLFILQNHNTNMKSQRVPQLPTSGSLFLYDRNITPSFRGDGHSWRKRPNRNSAKEGHEQLKVDKVKAINCYYAKGEDNHHFVRRSYWMLDEAHKHIVLVHYRDTAQGRANSASISEFSPGQSYPLTPSDNQGGTATLNYMHGSSQSLCSFHSLEVSSRAQQLRTDQFDNSTTAAAGNVSALQELEMLPTPISFGYGAAGLGYGNNAKELDQGSTVSGPCLHGSRCYEGDNGMGIHGGMQISAGPSGVNMFNPELSSNVPSGLPTLLQVQSPGNQIGVSMPCTSFGQNIYNFRDYCDGLANGSSGTSPANMPGPLTSWPLETIQKPHFSRIGTNGHSLVMGDASLSAPQEAGNLGISACIEKTSCGTNTPDCYSMLPHLSQVQMHQLGADSRVTIIPEHKFEIKEIFPEWSFANEVTKVVIIGSFHCDPSEFAWATFGDRAVPIQIMQDGVICCEAPPNCAGKVTLCITCSNREPCSQVKGFEYRNRNSACNKCTRVQQEENSSMEEVQLLVKFVQMLLSDSSLQKGEGNKFNIDPSRTQKGYEDSVDYIIEALIKGCSTSSGTIDWLLQELLKDKLQQWLSARLILDVEGNFGHILTKKQQGIIHTVAGLGYEWALHPILASGVGVNFRDTNGWTALHWAARFGREKMVAALVAGGASVGADTDPNKQYPMGKNPASIAEAYGHKGIAGYLSDLALTTHLASLKIDEAPSSRVEAEAYPSSISMEFGASAEDQSSMKEVLAASRNAVQAAALIQEAFRVHSFKKRQHTEAATKRSGKVAATHTRNVAALTIQKHYKSWKRHKYFLTKIPQVLKIQAHIRGYRVRKYYRVIWAVGILEKIVLRWRRKGTGLRGYNPPVDENEEEDDDILRVYRRKKVDTTLRDAVERVRFMIRSREARDQYIRVLETFRQAKARLVGALTNEESSFVSLAGAFSMDNDNDDAFLPLKFQADSPDYSVLWS